MNVFLFQPRFEPAILAGTKRQTIRPPRADGRPRAKVGEEVSLRVWSGLPYRSKQRELARGKVTRVVPVRVTAVDVSLNHSRVEWIAIIGALNQFALSDGFTGWTDLVNWFAREHGFPFTGILTCWSPSSDLCSSVSICG